MKAHELASLLLKHPNARVYIEWPKGELIDGHFHTVEMSVMVPGEPGSDDGIQLFQEDSLVAKGCDSYISIRALPVD